MLEATANAAVYCADARGDPVGVPLRAEADGVITEAVRASRW
jgi:hypothetical protein